MQVEWKEHGIGREGEILMLDKFVCREDSQEDLFFIYTRFVCDLKWTHVLTLE